MRKLHYWHINYVKMNSCLQEKCSVAHKFENFLCSSRTLVLLEYYFDPVAYYLCKGKLIPLIILLYYFLIGFSPNVISPKPLFNCHSHSTIPCAVRSSEQLLSPLPSATTWIVSKRCWFMEWSVSSVPEAGWVTLEEALCSLSLHLSSYFPCLHVSHS